MMKFLAAAAVALGVAAASPALAQDPPRIVIGSPVIEPMPIAVPTFIDEGGAGDYAREISRVVISDLEGTGFFRNIGEEAHISRITSFDGGIAFEDWKAINAQVLVTGAVSVAGDRITVKFRAYDVFNGNTLEGAALQFAGTTDGWRRMAHKVADVIYSKITGEGGYFDSRVVFVSESGPKNNRLKRLAVMDYDGANVAYLTDSSAIVLAPRFSPQGDRIIYTSYETGFPRITLLDVGSLRRQTLEEQPGTMTFAPRFSPDGNTIVFSLERGGNTDIYALSLGGGGLQQLTNAPLDRDRALVQPRWQPDRLRKRPHRRAADLCHARLGRRGHPDLRRRGALWHPGLEPARRLHRLHQAERGPLPHRRHAHRRVGRTPPDRLLPGRGPDLGPERARPDVHPRNQRGGWADLALVRRHHRAEPQADPDRRPGLRPRLVAAFALKCDAAPDSHGAAKLLMSSKSSKQEGCPP
jgi:tol-pal system beta propeller repeat protein TolB